MTMETLLRGYGCFWWILCLCVVVQASDWTSWFSSSSSDDKAEVTNNTTPQVLPSGLLVSPIVNREISVGIQAPWETPKNILSALLCEAFALEGERILNALVERPTPKRHLVSEAEARKIVLDLLPNEESSSKVVLEWSLQLRSASPHCRSFQTLLPEHAENTLHHAAADENLWIVLYPTQTMIAGSQILSALDDATTEPFRWDFLAKGKATVDHLSDDQQQQIFLPNEPIFGNGPTNGPLVALYADLASPEFVKVYQSLKASSSSIRFVVRSYAHHNDTTHLTLRGYGVRLDIRNVEYKVFDDDRRYSTSSSNNTNDSGFMTLDDAIHLHPLAPQFLAGVNLTHIKSDNVSLKKHLWKQHDREPIVPPKWQRRKLSLQAATAIANSSDPLYTLERIVQDLPSTASTLVLMNVDDKIVQYTSQLDETLTRSTVLYINGKLVSAMDRPSFNIFELLDALRMAQVAMRQWRQDLEGVVPNNAIPAIYELWRTNEQDATVEAMDDQDSAMSKPSKQPLRIQLDKGWKKAIIFLNDVENDAQYSPWPTSVRQALMSVQYGMPPTIRRNLFTFVAVMDLEPNKGLDFAFQVAQSSYPIRIGVLLVAKAELEECALWLGANPDGDVCPTRRILPVGTTIQNVKAMPATTQAVHRLLSTFASDHEDEGLLISYLQYFITMMEDLGTSATISDLLDIHEKLLQGLRISREGRQIGFLALMDETSDYSYGKGLKFALEKGLNPGQSFLNGRPFVNEKTFAEEQTTIFTMIMKDEITDFTPRSVYRKLLSGDNVYPKLHPLLSDDEGSGRYQRIPGYLGTEKSILAANDATSNSSEAIFLFDAYLDYETEIGLKVAISLLSSLEEIGKKTENVVFVRIFASTDNARSSPLCPLFMNASALKIPELKDVLSKILVADEMKGDEIINALNLNLHDECAHVTAPSRRAITANGRVYDKISSSIDVEDMELLMSLELERSKRVTKTLQPESSTPIQPKDGFHVAHVAALLALDSKTERRRWTMDSESPLDYSWNKPMDIASPFQVEVTAIVNPVSEGAQRVAPILRLIRDQLKLPLDVKLAPSLVLEDSDKVPITSYYRLVLDSNEAVFSYLPTSHVLTVKVDVPEPWNVQQAAAVQDTDNLRCDIHTGCGDYDEVDLRLPMYQRAHVTKVQYVLKNLLVFGQCYDRKGSPPNGLQLNLLKNHDSVSSDDNDGSVEVSLDGSIARSSPTTGSKPPMVIYSDTLVMKNVGYWQLRANPGMWKVEMASKGAEIFELVPSQAKSGRIVVDKDAIPSTSKSIAMTNFATTMELLVVQRRPGFENANLFEDNAVIGSTTDDDTIHVFSLATGHLYERFLKIMMLSVTKRTSAPVKFWLFENFLSPTFKASATAMAGRIGCSVEFVTYKWPEWLRGQREKQRIIWGYKILFLDVLFPLSVKKIIYVDADQVVRGDLKELWDMDLKGAPYGYTPFCQSRASTLGYQFWREGFWKNHLRGKPYHISALYVVDLERFRSGLVGDQLRSIYQQLSADPNSLANLDQDLPNYAQHQVPIFSLPQEWLWCESWCSDDTKATAKTIDLCNNPEHKEPKVSMAKRIISGKLFPESWMELDAEVERYEQDYYQGLNHTVDGEFVTSYY